ncbi:hypothetical protein EVAR_23497_1 [Eumeta japonica]|uniref:Uncharacterized protein n=1 Tax=Eumeta variegata TaxID=151549 RepID=A0A4C1W4C5_EUMVA|nr:hypothetical protein EVAR_23497_1 [Eumeta japonica]
MYLRERAAASPTARKGQSNSESLKCRMNNCIGAARGVARRAARRLRSRSHINIDSVWEEYSNAGAGAEARPARAEPRPTAELSRVDLCFAPEV